MPGLGVCLVSRLVFAMFVGYTEVGKIHPRVQAARLLQLDLGFALGLQHVQRPLRIWPTSLRPAIWQ